jgi:hypothetical protein
MMELNLNEIEATAGTQVRRVLDQRTIDDYAEAMLAGAIFPPLTVFSPKGSERYVLADGFHRRESALECGYESFPCEMYHGSVHDALEYALGANDEHGLRRSNKDKRNAVELALKDPKWAKWSNAQIARLCRVSDQLVAKVRTESNLPAPDKVKMKSRSGKTIERKATTSRENETSDSDQVRNSEPANDVDKRNRFDIVTAIDIIKSMPFSGAEAVERLDLEELAEDFRYCRDWFDVETDGD